MKILIIFLGLVNGGYMLLDGLFVLWKGKYIGPEKPGPWAQLFYKLGMDVFKLGPLFIVWGVSWLVWTYGAMTHQHWVYKYGLILSLLTLWYVPVGSLISVAILIILLVTKNKLGV